jgi:hypothetical protein
MSAEKQINTVSVSFTQISKDAIVPGKFDPANKVPIIVAVLYLIFSSLWLIIENPWQGPSFFTLITLMVFLAIPTFLVVILFNAEWFEINRKDGAINRWSNSRKKKQLTPIRKDNLQVFCSKVTTSAKYGTRQYKIFIGDITEKDKKEHSLFTLPKETEEVVAQALTKSVEKFLRDFLDEKDIKSQNNEYKFSIPA